MRDFKYQLRNPNLYLFIGVICAFIVVIIFPRNNNTIGTMIINISYGYISSCIVYALTVTLKNKMDRERFMWQIYDMINELSNRIQELNDYPLDDKLTIDSNLDYVLEYDDLCELRSFTDNVRNGVNSIERIYYNLLKHSDCEAFVMVSNAINNLVRILCKCIIFDKDNKCEVTNSPVVFHKIEVDFMKSYISALVENIYILQMSITKEIEKK